MDSYLKNHQNYNFQSLISKVKNMLSFIKFISSKPRVTVVSVSDS
jgi:hypothetical protein